MIREAAMLVRDKPFAVDRDSFEVGPEDHPGYCQMAAVWFRRRHGRVTANAGWLRDYQRPEPAGVTEFLMRYADGRHGGSCAARWDGSTLWCLAGEAERARYLAVLRPMLEGYPALPPGYDGWWRFER